MTFKVIKFSNKEFNPLAVLRERDQQIFQIDDYVTNGTQMKGKIKRFSLSNDFSDIFVITDWSNVGMNIDSLIKLKYPNRYNHGESVLIQFGKLNEPFKANVTAVHLFERKDKNILVKYDLEIPIYEEQPTRIINIDEKFIIRSS